MDGSRLYPNTYNGEVVNGGVLSRNTKPNSAASPQWKGRVYLEECGWQWISAWESRTGEDHLRVRFQPMTDQQAARFCKPKFVTRDKSQQSESKNFNGNSPHNGATPGQEDIPF